MEGKSRRRRLDCEFNDNHGFISAQLLAAIKRHVSSRLDAFGQACVRKTYYLRSNCMAMMNELEVTDKPPMNDDLRIQQAQEVRDCTARFRPRPGISVGPTRISEDLELQKVGSRQPERPLRPIALEILRRYKEFWISSLFWHNNLRARNPQTDRRQENILFNASTETVRMICKLISR